LPGAAAAAACSAAASRAIAVAAFLRTRAIFLFSLAGRV
jgi:hypothetical protein